VEVANWLQTQWTAITAAPAVYVGTIIIVAVAAWSITRALLGAEAAAARERSEHLKERLAELEGEKTELLSKLEAHGEDIIAIKQELSAMPRIVVSEDEPADASDGTIWFQPEKGPKAK